MVEVGEVGTGVTDSVGLGPEVLSVPPVPGGTLEGGGHVNGCVNEVDCVGRGTGVEVDESVPAVGFVGGVGDGVDVGRF